MLFLVVLYVHVLAQLVLASSFAIETVSLWRMQRAKTGSSRQPVTVRDLRELEIYSKPADFKVVQP